MTKASITLGIDIDAFDRALPNTTLDASKLILAYLEGLELKSFELVEQSAERLMVTFEADGQFKEIHP